MHMNTPTPQSAQWMADAAKEILPCYGTDPIEVQAYADAQEEAVAIIAKHHASAGSDLSTRVRALEHALERIVYVVDRAGVDNLSQGVQLGKISWNHKMNDAMAEARDLLSPTTEPSPGRLAG